MSEFDVNAFLTTLTQRAGVYRMYDCDDELLYVGKARNLKNRVSSYFRARGLNTKTVALVARIHRIEITVTASEAEALLLEQTLIKQHRPQYNILLKDGKSYPFIHLSNHAYPLLTSRRGCKQRKDGVWFGPYPNSGAVRETLNYLQRLFKLRSCEDSFFQHRSRPCMQYEIRRCSAPCVGLISEQAYQQDIERARLFLNGDSQALLITLQGDMLAASERMAFEEAAELRDRIELLRQVQEKQRVNTGAANTDVWAAIEWQGVECLHRLAFRRGRLQNSQNFYPENKAGESLDELLLNVMGLFYLDDHAQEGIPERLVVDLDESDIQPLLDVFALQGHGRVRHLRGVRGDERQWRAMAEENARAGVQTRLSGQKEALRKLQAAGTLLGLVTTPKRIECFDISHSQGEATYASCVAFGEEGLLKKRYRRFTIQGVAAGDDYAALEQAVRRHLTRLKEQQDLPGLLLIDGGKGQVGRIATVLEELELAALPMWGISKGTTRKSGWEYLWQPGQLQPVLPDAHDDGFRLLQWVRDESHRFAITGHRKQRAKSRGQSELEQLQGVGPKRRKALLLHFGSLRNMKGAPREEFAKVEGISQTLADRIFAQLHGEAE
ncbi:MAG: excinuclease ABC subunit UvrC [Oceanobacter sp.]